MNLLKIIFFCFPILAFSEVTFKELPFDIGKPVIEKVLTPKLIQFTVNGEVALQRPAKEKEGDLQIIFVNNKIVGSVESFKGKQGFEHSANFSKNDYLIQMVQSNNKTFIFLRSATNEDILRILCFDKDIPHVTVIK